MEDPNRGYLQEVEDIAPTVSIVLVEQRQFAYKSINRPTYVPGDAEHILDDINALSQFRGHPNIAQLVATNMPPVFTGFLQIIERNEVPNNTLLVQWALHIGEALQSLYLSGRTHFDIKRSNIVLDSQKNAILIDIVLLTLAGKYGTIGAESLQSIARRLTEAIPEARISLGHALEELRDNKSYYPL
ncbi:hypothetical protein BDV06DRAFT_216136 [Aspergillus oleicola]